MIQSEEVSNQIEKLKELIKSKQSIREGVQEGDARDCLMKEIFHYQ